MTENPSPGRDENQRAPAVPATAESNAFTTVYAKRLPFGGEFSPGQVDLAWLLEAADRADGSRTQLVEIIRAEYFAESCTQYEEARRIVEQSKRAGNVVIGMKSYGILGDDNRLSPLGQRLLPESSDRPRLY